MRLLFLLVQPETQLSVTITCTTTNFIPPPSSYKFFHHNELVQDSAKNTYTITDITNAHTGAYKCRPVNAEGPGPDAGIALNMLGIILYFHFAMLIFVPNW